MSDDFTADTALNTALWEANGPAATAALPNFDSPAAALVAPDLSFSSAGMQMSGVTSDYQQGGIQSVQSLAAPLTLTATVTPEEVGSGAFQLSLTSANGASGVSIDGGSAATPEYNGVIYTAPSGAGGQWVPQGQLSTAVPAVGTAYTLAISITSDGAASVSASSGGVQLGQGSLQVGTGPFYVLLSMGSGAQPGNPADEAVWQSVLVTNSSPSTSCGVVSSAQPSQSLTLPAGCSQYFYVGSTSGGYPGTPSDDLSNISWSPDLSVNSGWSGNLAVSIGRSTSDVGSYYSPVGNFAIAGAGVSGYSVAAVYSNQASALGPGCSGCGGTAAAGVSLNLSFTTSSGDEVLMLVGGQGTGSIAISGVSATSLQDQTYSEAGSNVYASAAVFSASLSSGSYTATFDSTSSLNNSGNALGAVAYILAPSPQGVPTNVTAIAGDSSATVAWAPPTSAGTGPVISAYLVNPFLGSTALSPIEVGPTDTTYTVNGLTNGSTYTFTVVAVTVGGNSPPSSPSNPVTPQAIASAVATPNTIDFGATAYYANETSVPVTIANNGTVPLAFQGDPTISGPDASNFGPLLSYQGSATTCGMTTTLEPGQSCSFTVGFFPTPTGSADVPEEFTATMTVWLDHSVSVQVALSGSSQPMTISNVYVAAMVNPIVVIIGQGFGSAFPSSDLGKSMDTPYLLLEDSTQNWSAGYEPYNDGCHVKVLSWNDTEIVLHAYVGGWFGDYEGCPTPQAGDAMVVQVWNPSNTSLSTEQFTTTAISTTGQTVPSVSGVSPNTGPVDGSTPITITGTNFPTGSVPPVVLVGGVAATDVQVNSQGTVITAVTSPSTTASGGQVVVVDPSSGLASQAGCWVIQDCADAFFYTTPVLSVPQSDPVTLKWYSPDLPVTITVNGQQITVELSGVLKASFYGDVAYSENDDLPSAVVADGQVRIEQAQVKADLESGSLSGTAEVPLPLGLPDGLDAYVRIKGSVSGEVSVSAGLTGLTYSFSGLGFASGVQLGSGSLSCNGSQPISVGELLNCVTVGFDANVKAHLNVSPFWLQAGFMTSAASLDAGIGPELGLRLDASFSDNFSPANPDGTSTQALSGDICVSGLEWHASASLSLFNIHSEDGGPVIGPFNLAGDKSICPLDGNISVSASGSAGTLTASADPPQGLGGIPVLTAGFVEGDPAGPTTFDPSGAYFYLKALDPQGITDIVLSICGSRPAGAVWWWTGTAWELAPASELSPPQAGQASCFSLDLSASTSPSTVQLGDFTFFALGTKQGYWQASGGLAGPSPRSAPAMATSHSGLTLLFGGGGPGNTFLSDTWALPSTASTWELTATATTGPSGRTGASMVWDPEMDEFVLFGGVSSKGFYNDTWAFDPTSGTWSKLTPSTSPPARAGAVMAALPNGDIVLFGGLSLTGYLSDTWVYDPLSGTWAEERPATSPSGRYFASMASGPATGTVVLFGGTGASGLDGGTWSYDLPTDTWSKLSVSGTAPPARFGADLAYDAALGQFILVDGVTASGYSGATFSFDPSTNTWAVLGVTTSPPAREAPGFSYDPATGTLLQFGGWDGSGFLGDTWELAP